MSVPANIPQVAALKKAVEDKIEKPLSTHSEFTALVEDIQIITGYHTSESTYERLWAYSTRKCKAISIHILDVLCKYVGFNNWADFLQYCSSVSPVESEDIIPEGAVDASAITQGTEIRLAWLPDRQMIVRCIGKCRFEVVESVNTGISVGDTFSAIIFQKGRELFLDKYLDATGIEHRYAVGQKNGLSSVQIIK